MEYIQRLRELASWYRDLAEQTESSSIRQDRLRTADLLEREAECSELAFASPTLKLRARACSQSETATAGNNAGRMPATRRRGAMPNTSVPTMPQTRSRQCARLIPLP
jgi:hypothetical protein